MSYMNKNPFDDPPSDDLLPIDPSFQYTNNRNSTLNNENTNNQQNEPHIQLEMKNVNQQTFSGITRTELYRRQNELDRLKAELERHENGNALPPNNWPPFSKESCFQPCFYQDITLEIPLEFQGIVMNLYCIWKLYILTLFANIIGGFLILFSSGKFITLGMSIVNFFLLTPVSYLCWFRPAYIAFRNNSNFHFIIFFICYLFQTQITVYQAIGISDTGNCGFQLALKQFSINSFSKLFIGLILLKIALCYGICALANLIMLTRVFKLYRKIRSKRNNDNVISLPVIPNN